MVHTSNTVTNLIQRGISRLAGNGRGIWSLTSLYSLTTQHAHTHTHTAFEIYAAIANIQNYFRGQDKYLEEFSFAPFCLAILKSEVQT